MTLDFEKGKLVGELEKRKPKKVLIQLAEGIKRNVPEIYELLAEKFPEMECVFSGETCWGGCSIGVQEAKALDADLIVHFGHAQFIETPEGSPEILYIEVKDLLDLEPILKKSVPHLKEYKTIGLSYSIQHLQDAEKIKKFYESRGKKVIFSKKKGLVAHEGHIVGCQYSGLKEIQEEVDAFLIFGNQFHSMGATLAVKKPVILVDVYNDDVRSMAKLREKILRQRAMSIEKLKEAKNVGIIVENKIGQRFGSPNSLLEKFQKQGKKTLVISMSEITPEKIMNFYSIDAFVELACPRIALDDFAKYPKPILTMKEALVAIGEKSWEDFLEEGIL